MSQPQQLTIDEVATLHDIERKLGIAHNMTYVWKSRYPQDFPKEAKRFGNAAVYEIAAIAAFARDNMGTDL